MKSQKVVGKWSCVRNVLGDLAELQTLLLEVMNALATRMAWLHVSQMSGDGGDHGKLRNTQPVSRAAIPHDQPISAFMESRHQFLKTSQSFRCFM